MRLSRPVLYSALWSCCVHSVALGFAATLVVSQPQRLLHIVQVTLMQQATPLPIGEGKSTEKLFASVERPAPASQAPLQPKSKPIAKPQLPQPFRPVLPKAAVVPERKKPEPPAEVTQPPQSAAPTQVAIVNYSVAADPGSETSAPSASANLDSEKGRGEEGRGNPGSTTKTGEGRSGSGGVAARPAYGVNPKPPYPMLARRLGAQGVVLLRVQVREDGSVAIVELAHSSGFSILDESATRTVRESWRFVPARIDGTPTASWVEVPIRFVLADS